MSNDKKKWLHANRKKSTTNSRTITVSAELAEFIEGSRNALEEFLKKDEATLVVHRAHKDYPKNSVGLGVAGENPKLNLLRALGEITDHYSEIGATEYDNALVDIVHDGTFESIIATTLELEGRFINEQVNDVEDLFLHTAFVQNNLEKVIDYINLLTTLLEPFHTYIYTGEDSHIAPYLEFLDNTGKEIEALLENDYNTVIPGGDNTAIFEKTCQNHQTFKQEMIAKYGGARGEELVNSVIADEIAKLEQKLEDLKMEEDDNDD